MCITCEGEMLERTTAVELCVVDTIAPSKYVFQMRMMVGNGLMRRANSNDVEDVLR